MCLYIISLVVYSGLKMNSAVVLSLTAIMLFVHGTFGSDEDELIKSIYAKCRAEIQVEENDMESFKKMELPTSNKGQCMMGCLMREAAIIVNGRFDKEGALRVAERYYSDKHDDMEKARNVIDICEKQIENETEECSIAGKLANCVIEEAQKIGLTSIPTE